MEKEISKMNFAELQENLSKEAQMGHPMFLAGIVFWLCVWIGSFFLPTNILVWIYIFGVGLVLPLGILLSKLLSINFLATHNPLSTIGGLVGGVQIFFAPIIILIAYEKPEWMPFIVAILTGAHFLPYVAIYKSKVYLFQTISTVAGASIIGIFWMEQVYTIIPIYLVFIYFITFLLLRIELKASLTTSKSVGMQGGGV